MSIKSKLTILFIAISFIPLALVTSLIFLNYKNSLQTERLNSLEALTILKANNIESFFEDFKINIAVAQGYWNIKTNMPVVMKYLKERNNPDYIAAKKTLDSQLQIAQKEWGLFDIMLISPEGVIAYCSSPKHEEKELGKKLSELPFESFTEVKKGVRFSEIFGIPIEENKFAIDVTAPAYDMNGNLIGAIVFTADMAEAYKIIQNTIGLGETGETLVAKRMGNKALFLNPLRYDPQAALRREVIFGDKTAYATQQAVQGKTGTGLTLDYRGKEVIASWRYLPSIGWGMVTKIDAQEAFGPVIALSEITFIVGILMTIIIIIMSLAIAKSITDPLYVLRDCAVEIGKGNLDCKVGAQENDEIGQLSRTFDTMTENLKNYQEKLVQSEKFAYLGKLSGFLSHELKNPLGVMKNTVYYFNMLELGKDNAEIKENLDILSSEIEKSNRIITDLLEFSRLKKPNLHPENINLIVEEILNRLKIGPHIRVTKELQNDLPKIEVDALHIHQVFYNLAKNALEAMEAGGELKIKTAGAGNFIEATFSDTGSGIPKENLPKIFEPLFSTKPTGTGFGLAICNALIGGHNGEIAVQSETGQGTTFVVKLPIERGA